MWRVPLVCAVLSSSSGHWRLTYNPLKYKMDNNILKQCVVKRLFSKYYPCGWHNLLGAGQNIPCQFLPPRTKHPTKNCHPGQKIPCCFCHPGHNIPCCFCHPGHNIPCHFCQPGQNIPHSDCSFRVSLIWDLHLLLSVLAVNALLWLFKWYILDLKLIERQFHNVNKI